MEIAHWRGHVAGIRPRGYRIRGMSEIKKIMAVYDVDSRYADRFAEFANQREQVPFRVVAFTSLEKLREFSEREEIAILLVGDSVTQEELIGIRAAQIVRLSETGLAKEGEAVVYKYQASDSLLREVMSWYQPQEILPLMTVTGRRSQIVGVYSPIGRCGKTSFALTLGQVLARDEKVLYLTLEEFSALSALTATVYTSGLSDLLYYYIQREYSPVRLGSVTYNWGGLDYIPPLTNAEDKNGISQEVFTGLIRRIAADGAYETLLLDIGMFCGGAEELLSVCDLVYVPVKEDVVSAAKLEEWKEYLKRSGRSVIWEKLRFLKLPGPGQALVRENYLEQLLWGELGDFVRELR